MEINFKFEKGDKVFTCSKGGSVLSVSAYRVTERILTEQDDGTFLKKYNIVETGHFQAANRGLYPKTLRTEKNLLSAQEVLEKIQEYKNEHLS